MEKNFETLMQQLFTWIENYPHQEYLLAYALGIAMIVWAVYRLFKYAGLIVLLFLCIFAYAIYVSGAWDFLAKLL